MDGKNYTVMELAEQIGVPRTTINDWLARYSMYIDTVTQGKRKVYPETALGVLREVAALRSAGKAFSEIETELAAKHPIQAVPLPPQEEAKPEAKKEEKPSEGAPAQPDPAASGEEGSALVPRQQTEEIGRLIGESFRNMDQRIKELEGISSAQRKMTYLWQIICVLFLIFLAVGGYLALRLMNQAKEENRQLQNQNVQNTARLTALQEQSVTLIKGNKEFQANITRLKSELTQQKKEFEQNIRTEKQRLNELHQAKEKALLSERDQALLKVKEQETRLALEKEKFTAERLKILNELDELKKQHEKLKKEKQPEKPAKPVKPAVGKKPKKPAPAAKPVKPEKKAPVSEAKKEAKPADEAGPRTE
jgi:hypothetical protein